MDIGHQRELRWPRDFFRVGIGAPAAFERALGTTGDSDGGSEDVHDPAVSPLLFLVRAPPLFDTTLENTILCSVDGNWNFIPAILHVKPAGYLSFHAFLTEV